jgi:hypothetical protein
MDALLGKITNLAYEFFGVFLPGVLGSLFLAVLWGALGPLVTTWSLSAVPTLTLRSLANFENRLSGLAAWTAALFLFAIWYFLGHALHWLSRVRGGDAESGSSLKSRMWALVRVRVPKLSCSYDPRLQGLFEAASAKLSRTNVPLIWREFYPVAKTLLSQKLTYSLVATYQNKYTLHRSICVASAWLFWLSVLANAGALLTQCSSDVFPGNWLLLVLLPIAAAVSALGFGSSYLYAWTLFGDSIVTETYCLLFGPSTDAEKTETNAPSK